MNSHKKAQKKFPIGTDGEHHLFHHRSGISTLHLQVAVRSWSLSLAHSLWWLYFIPFEQGVQDRKRTDRNYGQTNLRGVLCHYKGGGAMFGAENLMVDIGGAKLPVAVFGKGKRNIIMLPGVGDGLHTVEGKALMLALGYQGLCKEFRVFVMSRRVPFPEHQSTKEMADDIKTAMDKLGIEKASFIGVSMGGMITQHFAASYPERTE